MKNIYSPRQILSATFFGGPFTATYLLKNAFESINKPKLAKKLFIFSLLASAAIIGILPFLPENTPNNAIPLAYLIPISALLKNYYLSKEEIINSPEYQFESNWKVFGISLGGIIVYVMLVFSMMWVIQSDDDVAQQLTNNINKANIAINDNYFIEMKALKDPNGAGIFLNFTLNNNVIFNFKNTNQQVLRNMAIQFIGKDFLRDIDENNIYIIVNFQTLTHDVIKKVILSPSNIESDLNY